MLVLLFVALWFILRGDCFKSYLVLFCSCVLSSFSIAIISLGEERANLCFFVRLFDLCLFVFVCFSSSWCLGSGGCGL